MNNLNKIGGEIGKYYNQPPVEQGLINETLPTEIFVKVLFHLDKMSMQEACLVNRLWSEASVDTAKRKGFSIIKAFGKFLAGNLHREVYAGQKKTLCVMGSDTLILNSVNLLEVKSSIISLREKISNILKDLRVPDLETLRRLSIYEARPHFFENLFTLAMFYKQIDEAYQKPNEDERLAALQEVAKLLTRSGYSNKAIDLANRVMNECGKGALILLPISRTLMEIGKPDEAIEVANSISNEETRDVSLQTLINELKRRRMIAKAVEVANMISHNGTKRLVLLDVFKSLMKTHKIDEAIDIAANKIPDENKKEFLGGILTALLLNGNKDKASEVSKLLREL